MSLPPIREPHAPDGRRLPSSAPGTARPAAGAVGGALALPPAAEAVHPSGGYHIHPRHALAQLMKESASFARNVARTTATAAAGAGGASGAALYTPHRPLGSVISGRAAAAGSPYFAPRVPTGPRATSPVRNAARVTSTFLRQLRAVTDPEELVALEDEVREMLHGNEVRIRNALYHDHLMILCHHEERAALELEFRIARTAIVDAEAHERLYGSSDAPAGRSVAAQARASTAGIAKLRLFCEEATERCGITAAYPPPAVVEAYHSLCAARLSEAHTRGMKVLHYREHVEFGEMAQRWALLVPLAQTHASFLERARAWLTATLGTIEYQRAARSRVETIEADGRAALESRQRAAFDTYVAEAYQQRRWISGVDIVGLEMTRRAQIELHEEHSLGTILVQHRRDVRTAHNAAGQRLIADRERLLRWQVVQEEGIRWTQISAGAHRRWFELYQQKLMREEAFGFVVHDEACRRRDLLEQRRKDLELLELKEADRRRPVAFRDHQRQQLFEEFVACRVALMRQEDVQRERALRPIERRVREISAEVAAQGDVDRMALTRRIAVHREADTAASALFYCWELLRVEAEEERARMHMQRAAMARLMVEGRRALQLRQDLNDAVPLEEAHARESLRTEEQSVRYMLLAHVRAVLEGGGSNLEAKLLQGAEERARGSILVEREASVVSAVLLPVLCGREAILRDDLEERERRVRGFEMRAVLQMREEAHRQDLVRRQQSERWALLSEGHMVPSEHFARAALVAMEEDSRRCLGVLLRRMQPLFRFEAQRWDIEEAECEARMTMESAAELCAGAVLRMATVDYYPRSLGRERHLQALCATRPVEYVTTRSLDDEYAAVSVVGRATTVAYVDTTRDVRRARRPLAVTWGTFLLEQLLAAQHDESAAREAIAAEEQAAMRLQWLLLQERSRRVGIVALQTQMWALSAEAHERIVRRDGDHARGILTRRMEEAEEAARADQWVTMRQDLFRFIATRDEAAAQAAEQEAADLRLRLLLWQGPLLNTMYDARLKLTQEEFAAFKDMRLDYRRTVFAQAYQNEIDAATVRSLLLPPEHALLPTQVYYARKVAPNTTGIETDAAARHGDAVITAANLLNTCGKITDAIEREENAEFAALCAHCLVAMPHADHRVLERAYLDRLQDELRALVGVDTMSITTAAAAGGAESASTAGSSHRNSATANTALPAAGTDIKKVIELPEDVAPSKPSASAVTDRALSLEGPAVPSPRTHLVRCGGATADVGDLMDLLAAHAAAPTDGDVEFALKFSVAQSDGTNRGALIFLCDDTAVEGAAGQTPPSPPRDAAASTDAIALMPEYLTRIIDDVAEAQNDRGLPPKSLLADASHTKRALLQRYADADTLVLCSQKHEAATRGEAGPQGSDLVWAEGLSARATTVDVGLVACVRRHDTGAVTLCELMTGTATIHGESVVAGTAKERAGLGGGDIAGAMEGAMSRGSRAAWVGCPTYLTHSVVWVTLAPTAAVSARKATSASASAVTVVLLIDHVLGRDRDHQGSAVPHPHLADLAAWAEQQAALLADVAAACDGGRPASPGRTRISSAMRVRHRSLSTSAITEPPAAASAAPVAAAATAHATQRELPAKDSIQAATTSTSGQPPTDAPAAKPVEAASQVQTSATSPPASPAGPLYLRCGYVRCPVDVLMRAVELFEQAGADAANVQYAIRFEATTTTTATSAGPSTATQAVPPSPSVHVTTAQHFLAADENGLGTLSGDDNFVFLLPEYLVGLLQHVDKQATGQLALIDRAASTDWLSALAQVHASATPSPEEGPTRAAWPVVPQSTIALRIVLLALVGDGTAEQRLMEGAVTFASADLLALPRLPAETTTAAVQQATRAGTQDAWAACPTIRTHGHLEALLQTLPNASPSAVPAAVDLWLESYGDLPRRPSLALTLPPLSSTHTQPTAQATSRDMVIDQADTPNQAVGEAPVPAKTERPRSATRARADAAAFSEYLRVAAVRLQAGAQASLDGGVLGVTVRAGDTLTTSRVPLCVTEVGGDRDDSSSALYCPEYFSAAVAAYTTTGTTANDAALATDGAFLFQLHMRHAAECIIPLHPAKDHREEVDSHEHTTSHFSASLTVPSSRQDGRQASSSSTAATDPTALRLLLDAMSATPRDTFPALSAAADVLVPDGNLESQRDVTATCEATVSVTSLRSRPRVPDTALPSHPALRNSATEAFYSFPLSSSNETGAMSIGELILARGFVVAGIAPSSAPQDPGAALSALEEEL